MEPQPSTSGLTFPRTAVVNTQTKKEALGSPEHPIEVDEDNEKNTQTDRVNLPAAKRSSVPVARIEPQLPETFGDLENQMNFYQQARRIPPAAFIAAYQKAQKQRAEERARNARRN